MDFVENGTCIENEYGWKTSECSLIYDDYGNYEIEEGTCSSLTENLLSLKEDCAFVYLQQKEFILNTMLTLLFDMCKSELVYELLDNIDPDPFTERIVPLESVIEFSNVSVITELHQGFTKNGIFVLTPSTHNEKLSSIMKRYHPYQFRKPPPQISLDMFIEEQRNVTKTSLCIDHFIQTSSSFGNHWTSPLHISL